MIRKMNPKATFKLVSTSDPALDEKASNIDAYRKTHNLDYLKFKEGEKPTYFICKPLSQLRRAVLEAQHQEMVMPEVKDGKAVGSPTIKLKDWGLLMVNVFAECVTQVENEINGQTVIEDCSVEEFGPSVVGEIGAFVFNRGNVSLEEKKS